MTDRQRCSICRKSLDPSKSKARVSETVTVDKQRSNRKRKAEEETESVEIIRSSSHGERHKREKADRAIDLTEHTDKREKDVVDLTESETLEKVLALSIFSEGKDSVAPVMVRYFLLIKSLCVVLCVSCSALSSPASYPASLLHRLSLRKTCLPSSSR